MNEGMVTERCSTKKISTQLINENAAPEDNNCNHLKQQLQNASTHCKAKNCR
jgi:hypothetical protein